MVIFLFPSVQFNFFLQRFKVLAILVFHLFGQSYSKIFYVICGYCDVLLISFSAHLSSVKRKTDTGGPSIYVSSYWLMNKEASLVHMIGRIELGRKTKLNAGRKLAESMRKHVSS